MRRVLVVNALIFAVLAAAVALAYYGYSGTTEQGSRVRDLMQDLAEEKVLNIESLIADADTKLLSAVQLDPIPDLAKLQDTAGAAVSSIYVLDDKMNLLPNGFHATPSRDRRVSMQYRDWFLRVVLPYIAPAQQKVNTRAHAYFNLEGTPYLFSYMRRVANGQTFYVVIEDDLNHLVFRLFPQFFPTSSKRLYQIVDERGQQRYGEQFGLDQEGLVVEQKFSETVDGWVLRVAQKDLGDQEALERKGLLDSLLIGGAVVVILGGLAVLGFSMRRERRLNELKSEFISNVSHELKTPLSIISMFGEMLANGRTRSPEQAHEYAEIIWRESVRLGRLIDNVLDFAKIERGLGVYEFDDDADLGEVAERAIELSARRVAAAEMTLSTDIAPDLPAVRLDANAYTLAVLNLIDNAIKYAVDGKRIEVSLRASGDRVVLAVRDWGPGIDPEERERIFERFYRARAVRLKPIRGSGIGLALVQHIARAHGGDVTVQIATPPERGSTFSIWLPTHDRKDA